MKTWIVYAFISMIFAGITGVIAKKGLTDISGDMGLTIRTCFVFVFTMAFAAFVVPARELALVKTPNWLWLAASAATTTLSWIFYYRAIQLGEVSTVALIDKGSVVVAVVLAFIVLHETITGPKLIGSALILAGILVIARA